MINQGAAIPDRDGWRTTYENFSWAYQAKEGRRILQSKVTDYWIDMGTHGHKRHDANWGREDYALCRHMAEKEWCTLSDFLEVWLRALEDEELPPPWATPKWLAGEIRRALKTRREEDENYADAVGGPEAWAAEINAQSKADTTDVPEGGGSHNAGSSDCAGIARGGDAVSHGTELPRERTRSRSVDRVRHEVAKRRDAASFGSSGDDPAAAVTGEHADKLTRAVRMIAMGENEPGGLEGLTMALCGGHPGQKTSVAEAITEVASALHRIANALGAQQE
jgi:hypothetical protein